MTANARDPDPSVERARDKARVRLKTANLHIESELVAYEVEVEGMGFIGRWAQTGEEKGVVTWTDGTHAETGPCDSGDRARVIAAIRPTIPIRVEYDERLKSGPPRLRILPGLGERS